MRSRTSPRWSVPAVLFAVALSAHSADISLVPGTLSPLFGSGLVPEYRESGIVFPAEAREDPASGSVVWFNALGNPFWFVPGDRAPVRAPWRVPPDLAAAATHSIGRHVFRHAGGDASLLPAASGGASPSGEPTNTGRRSSGIPGSRDLGYPGTPTNLLFSSFSHTGTSVLLRADWPAADTPLPENALDLYLQTNLLDEAWTLLYALPVAPSATNLSAEIPGADIPGFFHPGHVHDETCPVTTNLYPDPLTGLVETGLVYRCSRLSPVPPGAFFRLGTRHDSDFDGLPDAYEALASLTDPLDPDTDNDGIPDGLTREEWLAHPLWAAPGDDGNLLVESIAPLPTNSTAVLLLDDLAIPLAGPLPMLSFRLPPGRIVSCTLHSEETTLLWCSVPGSEYPSGGGLWSPPSSSPEPLWCDTPSSVFGPRTSGGSCTFAVPVLSAEPEGDLARHAALRSADESLCVHSASGAAFYRWSVSPALLADFVTNTEDLVSAGPGRVALSVSSPGETASGELVLRGGTPPLGHDALWGDVRLRLSAHGCLGGTGSPCLACGRVHPAGEPLSCFHEPGCAARADRDAPCTCPPPFVRIGREGALRLAGLDECCCLPIEAGEPPELLSAAASLGASVSNDWLIVHPFSPSPSVTGFPVRVRFYGDDGEEWRDLGFGVVAADLGIEPQSLSGAPAPPGEDALVHFFTGGTLHLARRAAPYPLSVWNQSPPDGHLEFAYLCSSNGPSLSCGGLALDAPAAFTNAPPLAAPNSAAIALLDASRSGTASLALTLSDPATNRTILSESLSVQVVDTALGEHWRVRSATDALSWDFSAAPTNVWVGIGHADENGVLTNTLAYSDAKTPSLSLDLPPGDYNLEAYFPRVWDGDSPVHSTTGMVHVRSLLDFGRPAYGLKSGSETNLLVSLASEPTDDTFFWTIEPAVEGGPRFASGLTGTASSQTATFAGTSVWIHAGTVPGRYAVTASQSYPVSRSASVPLDIVEFRIEPSALRMRKGGNPGRALHAVSSDGRNPRWMVGPATPSMSDCLSSTGATGARTNRIEAAASAWVHPGADFGHCTVRTIHPDYTNIVSEAAVSLHDIVLEPVTSETRDGVPVNPAGIVKNESGTFVCSVLPSGSVPGSEIRWLPSDAERVRVSGTGETVSATPLHEGEHWLEIDIGGWFGASPRISFRCFDEWADVDCHFVFVRNDAGALPRGVSDPAAFAAGWISEANLLFSQAGVRLHPLFEATNHLRSAAFDIDLTSEDGQNEFFDLFSMFPERQGINVFVINSFSNSVSEDIEYAVSPQADTDLHGISCFGIVIPSYMDVNTFSHETGHALGLNDIYSFTDSTSHPDGPCLDYLEQSASVSDLPYDWTGSVNYYPSETTRASIIESLLMYGRYDANCPHLDISHGRIKGYVEDLYSGIISDSPSQTGLSDLNRTPFSLSNFNPQTVP